jgi:nicotinamide mononucleotide transporter
MTILNYLGAHWLEIAGTVTTILGIWFTTRRMLICWPVVLAADFLYLIVFYRARLFSDALLQVFFVAFTIYGWWHWWRGIINEGEVRVVPLRPRGWIAGLIFGAAGAVMLGWLMTRVGAALRRLPAIVLWQVGGAHANTSQTGGSGLLWTLSTLASISTRGCN